MMSQLPSTIPIFPLTGSILLPECILNLYIFEPRYRQMVEETLETERFIGMIQPKSSEPEQELYPIGGVGKISYFQKLENENYLIRLHGICRFVYLEDLPTEKMYRTAAIESLEDNTEISSAKQQKERLYENLAKYFDANDQTVDWEKFDLIPLKYLINILCMNLNFSPAEKQVFVESPSLENRLDNLINLLEFSSNQDSSIQLN